MQVRLHDILNGSSLAHAVQVSMGPCSSSLKQRLTHTKGLEGIMRQPTETFRNKALKGQVEKNKGLGPPKRPGDTGSYKLRNPKDRKRKRTPKAETLKFAQAPRNGGPQGAGGKGRTCGLEEAKQRQELG